MPYLKKMERSKSFCSFNESFNGVMNNPSKFFLMNLCLRARANIAHVMMCSTFHKTCLAGSDLCSGLLCSNHLVLVFCLV